MRDKKILRYLIGVFFTLFAASGIYAQGTLQDYQRAISVDTLFNDKIYNSPSSFHWTKTGLLWYANLSRSGKEYLLVNPISKDQKKAFDMAQLTASMSEMFHKKIKSESLTIDSLEFDRSNSIMTFILGDTLKLECDLGNYKTRVLKKIKPKSYRNGYWGELNNRESQKDSVISPDRFNIAYIKNYNLYVRDLSSGEENQLSYDGSKGFFYSSNIKWSPDSKKVMVYKYRPPQEHKLYLIESSPKDQLQPKLQIRDYLKPGDEVAFRSPQLFLINDLKHIPVSTALFNHQYSLSNFDWQDDSGSFTFEYNQRGHQVYRVLSVSANTGEVRSIIDETTPTFIDYSGKKFRHDVKNTNEIIWASERDGWNHLYLYDGDTGKVKNKITTGDWPIREVLKVDDKKRQIYFTASGLDKDQDPYFFHYCRIDFDGKNFIRYTKENGNHKVAFSPDYKYYVDQFSRVDMPSQTLLKESDFHKVVKELEKSDIQDLLATGWRMPEVFNAKGRDGKTNIWGIIIRPTNFNPSKSYPIIEYIYAGPQDSFVPKDFHSYYRGMTSLAELGFIVVQIDGMGTSNRSKAFHDVCWKNLKDGGFPDRKLWIRAAAKKYPYMDIERVGIRGTSAGGQNAGAALVFNSDFYKVAVASCGCHDNRMDKMWWNEQWMGYPIGPQYAASSNVEHASQMNGDLMLILGEIDDNVDPSSTLQFADALIKADKKFELVILPGVSHTSGGEYGERKRKDFFVEKLLGVKPPSWDKIYNETTRTK
jgi:dipeptidyl aminopeptidase/acylaminoacyl peptidase